MIASDRLAPDFTPDSDVDAMLASAAEQAAVAGATPRAPHTGELTYRLTLLLFPTILLIFVALYVTSLASGAEPEMALLQAGGASVVLAILARIAIGILGSDHQPGLSDREIAALFRAGALREQMMATKSAGADTDAEHTTQAGSTAGDGGKE
jgi:hypothetical protein